MKKRTIKIMVKHKEWHIGLGNMLIVHQKVMWNYSIPTTIPLLTTPPSPSPLSLPLKYCIDEHLHILLHNLVSL